MNFVDLGLVAPILKALEEEGYSTPTPIQQQAIPLVLQERDLLGCAQTGTGKTAAFALPILQNLAGRPSANPKKRPIRTLILTPTRELAIQIDESFGAYGRHMGLRHTVLFGGVGQKPQTDALQRGVDILTATPGRLLDLMQQGFISLRDLEIFVLDEADRMLDMGFIHDVRKVIAQLPQQRQTLFFSATMPNEIQKLANSILTNPVKVEVTPVSSTADTIQQVLYFAEKKEKRSLLVSLLQNPDIKSVLVFTRTKHGANKVAKDLTKAGIMAEAIHGNKSQTARQTALANFKSGKNRALVATDIAARGIDIDDLSHVLNYDLPNVPETYVHRIGRTGRAGASGQSISFCDMEERAYLRDIEKLIGKKVPVATYDGPWIEVGAELPDDRPPRPERHQRGDRQARPERQRPEPKPRQERPAPTMASNKPAPQRHERNGAAGATSQTAPSNRPTHIAPTNGEGDISRSQKRRNRRNNNKQQGGERSNGTSQQRQEQPRQQGGERGNGTMQPRQEQPRQQQQRPQQQRPQQQGRPVPPKNDPKPAQNPEKIKDWADFDDFNW
jgi:ATP-dependent RNA helicase RhlE